jgi:hypothetical protein
MFDIHVQLVQIERKRLLYSNPLRYEVIFMGLCTSWGVMRVQEKIFTVIFVFIIANLNGNDFQTIMFWGGKF